MKMREVAREWADHVTGEAEKKLADLKAKRSALLSQEKAIA